MDRPRAARTRPLRACYRWQKRGSRLFVPRYYSEVTQIAATLRHHGHNWRGDSVCWSAKGPAMLERLSLVHQGPPAIHLNLVGAEPGVHLHEHHSIAARLSKLSRVSSGLIVSPLHNMGWRAFLGALTRCRSIPPMHNDPRHPVLHVAVWIILHTCV